MDIMLRTLCATDITLSLLGGKANIDTQVGAHRYGYYVMDIMLWALCATSVTHSLLGGKANIDTQVGAHWYGHYAPPILRFRY